jgi:hypothetical protein
MFLARSAFPRAISREGVFTRGSGRGTAGNDEPGSRNKEADEEQKRAIA